MAKVDEAVAMYLYAMKDDKERVSIFFKIVQSIELRVIRMLRWRKWMKELLRISSP